MHWGVFVAGKDKGLVEVPVDGEEAVVAAKLPTAVQCKRIFQRELAGNIDAIVKGFVEEAKKGSCAHVKLANELLDTAIEQQAARRKGPAERQADAWILAGKPKAQKVRGGDGRFGKGSVLE